MPSFCQGTNSRVRLDKFLANQFVRKDKRGVNVVFEGSLVVERKENMAMMQLQRLLKVSIRNNLDFIQLKLYADRDKPCIYSPFFMDIEIYASFIGQLYHNVYIIILMRTRNGEMLSHDNDK